jgi:hypothetical protein
MFEPAIKGALVEEPSVIPDETLTAQEEIVSSVGNQLLNRTA